MLSSGENPAEFRLSISYRVQLLGLKLNLLFYKFIKIVLRVQKVQPKVLSV